LSTGCADPLAALPAGALRDPAALEGADGLPGQGQGSELPVHQQGFCLSKDCLLGTKKESSDTVAISFAKE